MELLLIKEELWIVIEYEAPTDKNGLAVWVKNDDKTRAHIGLFIEDNQIIPVIKLLSRQDLGLRGSDENFESRYRGNYLICLMYLAEFDDFLTEHLRRYGNLGKDATVYLSHPICDEFFQLMKEKLLDKFKAEIKSERYFSVIVDSIPDISHCDQLMLVLRYA